MELKKFVKRIYLFFQIKSRTELIFNLSRKRNFEEDNSSSFNRSNKSRKGYGSNNRSNTSRKGDG